MGASVILECIDASSYRGLDLVCGPKGGMIEVDAAHMCPTNQIEAYSTPFCVQCGPRGERGSAVCVASLDAPCPDVVAGRVAEETDK